jgi:tetratricopeptide (TPR) repeat protein
MRNLILLCAILAVAAAPAALPAAEPQAAVPAAEAAQPAWVYKGQGDRYAKMGELGKAIVAYKKALTSKTPYPEVNLQLARVYAQDGLYDLAFSQIRIAETNKDLLEIPDLIYEVKYVKAEILQKQNKNAEAVYREIIEGDENWKIYMNEPYQNTILGRAIGSKEEQAKYAKAHFELGRMKYDNGNFENALRFLEMAVLYKYNSETAMRYLIDSYKKLGNRLGMERAMEAYRRMKQ